MAMATAISSPMLSGSVSSSLCRNSLPSNSSSSSSSHVCSRGLLLKNVGTVRKNGSPTSSRISRKRQDWRQCRASYSGVGTDYASAGPIDVQAEVKTQKVVILGGNGFVGSAIAKEAVKQDIEVVSVSRSGKPSLSEPWLDKVTWIAGNVFTADWDVVLEGATAVISCLGGFGSNEEMERLNGDANVVAVEEALNAGIKKFVYISVHDYNLPDFALQVGYFTGKRRAEQQVLLKYPATGTILRPGFIYGARRVNGFDIPLNLIGEPLEKLLAQAESFTKQLSKVPASDLLLAPPVSVQDVAKAALKAVKDDDVVGILDIKQIKELAALVD